MMLRRLCRHPKKWTVRYIFQAYFLSILSILILVALLAYLTSNYLSPYSTHQGQFQEAYYFSMNSNSSFGNQKMLSRYQDGIKLISLASAPKREVKSQQRERSISLVAANVISRKREERRISTELNGGSWTKCSTYNCFDIHRCGMDGKQTLSIYIYPIEKFIVDGIPLYRIEGRSGGISREFYEFLDAIRQSPYYVPDPKDACIFVPSIDTFANPSLTMSSLKNLQAAFSSLEFWGEDGQNHLLLSMFPGNSSLLYLDTEAIIASAGFPVEPYRLGFHVPLISYNPLLREYRSNHNRANSFDNIRDQHFLAISAQGHLPLHLTDDNSILILDFCTHKYPINYLTRCKDGRVYNYPEILSSAEFCLVVKDLAGPALWDIMSVGCIPVIIADSQRLPFDEVIDWKKNAIILYENQIPHLSSILQTVSEKRKRRLKSHVQFTFNTYFKSMHHITTTLLQVLQYRVFSHTGRTLDNWNRNFQLENQQQPLFNPLIAPKDAGFTAVILAYERVPSLFQVVERVSLVPSLAKIIVVWNNQVKPPPHYNKNQVVWVSPSTDSAWPKTSKPLKVIQMDKNKMSNRFYPFDEIETEAVFSLDDDIIMLTADEIEFGFEVVKILKQKYDKNLCQAWREFPDRIVGFPSRSHVWDNTSRRWKYESEWTNEISMVLTGAAFYHKYWHHAYSNEMSSEIREWVDSRMNCEDIAMNFLVSAKTGKSPIKVTPRKKFKCPTCSNNEMLSSDSSHMVERTDCINKFVQVYGNMPLVAAEFRVDPVLYKVDNLPKRLKKFRDVGSL